MEVRYFDNSATTRIKEEILTEMFPFLSREYGNPSSLYSIGRKSKRAIEEARKRVASLINCNSEEIYFTSCGSESDNTALKGIAYANSNKGKHIITSKIEHPAILHSCQNLEKKGFEVTYLDVDKDGFVNLQTLENSIRQDTILISVMFANNEIGTIEPIQEIAKIAHKNGIIFHTDAVQACGNIPIDVQKMDIDMLSLSGHKIYAPKGIGALYVKKGIEFERFMDGGHQEKNKRSGTENVAEIVALGKAIELIYFEFDEYNKKLLDLREYYLTELKKRIPEVKLNGDRQNRLAGNANVSFDGINGEELLLELDSKGICASAGSACTTGSMSPSHVLMAIGLKESEAGGALRTTFGRDNNMEDIDYLVQNLDNIVKKLQKNEKYE